MMILLFARLAFADVVDPEPTNCPAGSIGRSGHSGTWCEPAPECDPATCAEQCRSSGLCVTEEEVPCGGMQPDTGDCTFTKIEAHGRCREQSDCDVGTCVVEDRCVEAGPLSCGGCGSTAPAGAAAIVGLALLALASTRR